MELEITASGYLHLPASMAEQYFPYSTAFAYVRDRELWLLPSRHNAGGGLLLKQRNLSGERSLLLHAIDFDAFVPGRYRVYWDEQKAALRIPLEQHYVS